MASPPSHTPPRASMRPPDWMSCYLVQRGTRAVIALLSATESRSFMVHRQHFHSVIPSASLCSFLFLVYTASLPQCADLLINCLKWIEKANGFDKAVAALVPRSQIFLQFCCYRLVCHIKEQGSSVRVCLCVFVCMYVCTHVQTSWCINIHALCLSLCLVGTHVQRAALVRILCQLYVGAYCSGSQMRRWEHTHAHTHMQTSSEAI